MTNHTLFTVHSGTRLAPVATIEVDGELDSGSAPGFRSVMRDFVGDPDVTIDLTRCNFIDSVGICALVGAVHRIRRAGGFVRVVANTAVKSALRAARAESLLAGPPTGASAAG